MRKLSLEFIVGLFLLTGIGATLYLSVVVSGVAIGLYTIGSSNVDVGCQE